MTGPVVYGGHIFILKSRVALRCMIDSWRVLNVLTKFWLVWSSMLASEVGFLGNSKLLKDSPSGFVPIILSERKGQHL